MPVDLSTIPDAKERRVQGIHNEWLKHQCTRELVERLQKHRQYLLSKAIQLSAKSEEELHTMSSLLSEVRGLDKTMEVINTYANE